MKTLFLFLSTFIVVAANSQQMNMRTLPQATSPTLADTMIIQNGGKTKAVRLSLLAPLFAGTGGNGGTSLISSFNSRVGAIVPDVSDYASYYAALNHAHTYASLTGKPTTLATAGITDGLTPTVANSTYAPLSHTQVASTITDFGTTVDARITSKYNIANGIATLDGAGKIAANLIAPTDTVHFDPASKQNVLVSGTNIKSINNQSILGAGNITISGTAGDLPVLSANPSTGNAYISSVDNRIHYLIGNNTNGTWYRLAVQDSTVAFVPQNLLKASDQFESGWWDFTTGLTFVANTQTGPNGGTTADQVTIVADGTPLTQNVQVTPNTQYTFSFYAKRGTATTVFGLSIYDGSNAANIVNSVDYYSLINASTWTRLTTTFTTPANCTNIYVYPLRTNAERGTVFLADAQLNQGAARPYSATVDNPIP